MHERETSGKIRFLYVNSYSMCFEEQVSLVVTFRNHHFISFMDDDRVEDYTNYLLLLLLLLPLILPPH
jgi:hypothetical protein